MKNLRRLPSGAVFNTDTGEVVFVRDLLVASDQAEIREWVATLPRLFAEPPEERRYNAWVWGLRKGDIVGWTFGSLSEGWRDPGLFRVLEPYDGNHVTADRCIDGDDKPWQISPNDPRFFRPTVEEIRNQQPNESRSSEKLLPQW